MSLVIAAFGMGSRSAMAAAVTVGLTTPFAFLVELKDHRRRN